MRHIDYIRSYSDDVSHVFRSDYTGLCCSNSSHGRWLMDFLYKPVTLVQCIHKHRRIGRHVGSRKMSPSISEIGIVVRLMSEHSVYWFIWVHWMHGCRVLIVLNYHASTQTISMHFKCTCKVKKYRAWYNPFYFFSICLCTEWAKQWTSRECCAQHSTYIRSRIIILAKDCKERNSCLASFLSTVLTILPPWFTRLFLSPR